jgi:hypothetical protein
VFVDDFVSADALFYLSDDTLTQEYYCLISIFILRLFFHYQQSKPMIKTKDLNDMMLFIAVIDAGSFTLAAERMNIPKANLSRKISRLEQQLGVTLLERTTRSQHIIDAGSQFLVHCRGIYKSALNRGARTAAYWSFSGYGA